MFLETEKNIALFFNGKRILLMHSIKYTLFFFDERKSTNYYVYGCENACFTMN